MTRAVIASVGCYKSRFLRNLLAVTRMDLYLATLNDPSAAFGRSMSVKVFAASLDMVIADDRRAVFDAFFRDHDARQAHQAGRKHPDEITESRITSLIACLDLGLVDEEHVDKRELEYVVRNVHRILVWPDREGAERLWTEFADCLKRFEANEHGIKVDKLLSGEGVGGAC